MTVYEHFITVILMVLATMITRFLPFLLFPSGKSAPKFVRFLGKALPPAVFGMLVIYCLKDVGFSSYSMWVPEFIAVAVAVLLHLYKRKTLLSIAGSTLCYMLLVQFVF